jgi:hypothetical protein
MPTRMEDRANYSHRMNPGSPWDRPPFYSVLMPRNYDMLLRAD